MQHTNIPYKYIIVAACFGTQAVGVGLFVSYGVFINPLNEEFGWSRAAISPIVAEYFGIGAHGVLFGAIVFSGCFGGSVGPVLAGHIFDVTGSYSPAFWLSTFIALLGLGFILLLKPIRKCGNVQGQQES